jgi:hypothetical protein
MGKIKNPQNARHLEHNDGQGRNIARKGGAPKRTNDGPVPHHPGMTSLQKNSAGFGGMGHATATISGGEAIAASAAAAPLAHSYGGAPDLKTGKRVEPVPGHRSRTNADCETHGDKIETGENMLVEAVKN